MSLDFKVHRLWELLVVDFVPLFLDVILVSLEDGFVGCAALISSFVNCLSSLLDKVNPLLVLSENLG